ncbi:MAG: beta strand repeat-containing protein, partial [Verrucomicrobium sp.]
MLPPLPSPTASAHSLFTRSGLRRRTALAARGLVCACMALTAIRPVSGQSLVWDGGVADGAQDGSGTWNTSNTNWLPTASSTSDANQSWPGAPTGLATTAIFGNGGTLTDATRVITVASGISVGGLTFNALNLTVNTNRAYRFTGGSLTFKDGAIIEIGQGATFTTVGQRIEMNTTISGSNVIIRKTVGSMDVGLMQFEAANTWTGTLGLEGALFIDIRNYNAISTLGAINVGSGSTLVINYAASGNTTTLNVPLTIAGIGSATRGAIRFDQAQTLAGAITLAETAAISANNTTSTISGNIGESGGSRQLRANINGSGGTLVLSGNNTFTGGLDIVSGTVRLGSAGALNASGANLVTFSGTAARTLALNGFSTTVSGLVYTGSGLATITNTSATAASLTLNPASGTNSFTGVIADGAGGGALTLIKNGAGTQILTGTTASTYTGGTIFNAGILGISNDGNLGAVPGSASAANLTFNGGVLQFNATMELNANRGTTLQAGGGVFETGTGTTVTYGGAISGAGSFTKRGAGTLALTGASNYSGQTLVTAGILSIRHNLALGSTAGETFVSGGAKLDLRNNVTVTGETVYTPFLTSGDGNNTWAGTVRGAVTQTLTIESESGNLLISGNVNAASTDNVSHTVTLQGAGNGEISGVLSNAANLVKSGTGTWKLSGNNTFTTNNSTVTLSQGRLVVSSLGALNATTPNAVSFESNGSEKILSVQGTNVLAGGLISTGGAGSIITENGGATDATLTLVVNTNRSYGGVIQDGAGGGKLGINMSGTAVQTLTGTGTYTGATTLTSGTLRLDFSGAGAPTSNIASSSSTLVAAGGTLNVVGSSTGAVSQTFNGLRVTTGASTLSVTTNTTTAQDVLLSLGAITRTGGTVNFLLPNGAPSVTNGIRTTTGNTNGILGAWATVNGTDWATVDSNGNIVAYADYTNVTNFGSGTGAMGPIPDNIGANVKIVDGGTSGSITLADAGSDGVTLVNTIMQTATGAATITFGASPSGKILRLGEQGGIVMTNTAGALTIGTTADEGSILTMGGATLNLGGDLLLNNASAAAMTINSNINDNGTGVVSLTKNGTGLLVLTGTGSTYSGGTFINA